MILADVLRSDEPVRQAPDLAFDGSPIEDDGTVELVARRVRRNFTESLKAAQIADWIVARLRVQADSRQLRPDAICRPDHWPPDRQLCGPPFAPDDSHVQTVETAQRPCAKAAVPLAQV